MDYKKIKKDLGSLATDLVINGIVPDYNSWVKGWCSDVEYFKYQYAGPDGAILKKGHPFSIKKKKEPLFYVRRPYSDWYGEKLVEFKVYNVDGKLLHKEVVPADSKLGKRSVNAFWRTAQYNSEDIYFYVDSQNDFYAIEFGVKHYLSCSSQYNKMLIAKYKKKKKIKK